MENMQPFYRDTWAEVDLNAIGVNVRNIKAGLAENTAFMAVVKANAYGHGAVDVAAEALDAGAEYLGVAILDEAVALRRAGIMAPLLVMGMIRPSDIVLASEMNIAVTAFQTDWLSEAEAYLQERDMTVVCHVKIDSGMGRLGVRTEEETQQLAWALKESRSFAVEGLYTHLATADELNTAYFEKQKQWSDRLMVQFEKDYGGDIPLKHCSNSAGALRFHPEGYNLVRVGISMYGLVPSPEIKPVIKPELEEAFSLHSRITHVKKLEPGEGISYGITYKTEKNEWIATVPIGYADGWIRKNQDGDVLVNGERARIVGRICMDQMMILLEEPVKVGTEVTLIGKNGGIFLPMDEVAARLDTINYEIPCTITSRVPRVVKKEGEILHQHNEILDDI